MFLLLSRIKSSACSPNVFITLDDSIPAEQCVKRPFRKTKPKTKRLNGTCLESKSALEQAFDLDEAKKTGFSNESNYLIFIQDQKATHVLLNHLF